MSRLVLFAVSTPYASEVVETVRRLGWDLAACVRHESHLPVPAEVPSPMEPEDLPEEMLALPFIVPIVTPAERHAETIAARGHGFFAHPPVVDPTAVVAASAELGEGTYVNAGAIVAAGVRAGESLSLNRGASVGHHTRIEDYVSVGPRAVTGGECTIERGAFLGVGAVIAPEVTVGANAVVGAGAVVVEDVPSHAIVVGNPARVLREVAGYGGAAVPA